MSRSGSQVAALAVVTALAAVAACGGDGAGSETCPADEPDSCPATVPSYATQIAPLIDKYCTTQCHNPTGSAADQPLSTWPDLYARRIDVSNQFYNCIMPLAPAPDPTIDERVELLTWLVCEAPNN